MSAWRPRGAAKPAGKQTGGQATLIAVAYSVVGVLPLFLVSAQAVQLQRELDFGKARLGLAVSLCFLASAATAAVMGRVLQRIGPAAGLRVSASASLAAVVVMATLASAWWHVVAALMLSGIANATAQLSTNIGLAGGVRAGRQGIAFGAKQAAVPLASLLAGLAVPVIALAAGWRAAFFAGAAVAVVALVLRPRFRATEGAARPPALGRPSALLVLTAVTGLLAGGAGNALAAFTVDAAVSRGIGEGAGGLLLALGSAAAVAGRVGVGWLADRRQSAGYAELAALMGAGAVALGLLAASGQSHVLFVAGILGAFASAWGWPGLIYYATVRSHPHTPGAATGVVLASVYVGHIAGPTIAGLLAEHRSYNDAWGLAALVLVLATLAALAARRLQAVGGAALDAKKPNAAPQNV